MDLGTYIFVGMVSLAIILVVGVISFIKNNYFIFKIIKNYPYLHDVWKTLE